MPSPHLIQDPPEPGGGGMLQPSLACSKVHLFVVTNFGQHCKAVNVLPPAFPPSSAHFSLSPKANWENSAIIQRLIFVNFIESPVFIILRAKHFCHQEGTTSGSILQRIDNLIGQILESYNLRTGQLNLKIALAKISELLAALKNEYSQQKPNVTLTSPNLAIAEFDPMMMERVFRNVIENAQKYSKPDSKPIEIKVEDLSLHWKVSVKDYGFGISSEDQKKVFDPFFRANQARNPNGKSGFGLGLSISKAITDAHGFTIELQSELHQGTTISILMKKVKPN